MNKLLCLLLVLSFGLSTAQAQRYSKRKIRKDLQELPGFENAFIGFLLVDPEKKKPLYEQYADKYMTPGSTTKLFTIYGAIQHLPDTLSALEYVVQGDSLIFWSTGYPLNLHPDHPDSAVVNFLNATDKQLFYWPRPTADSRFGPGWGWDDYPYYFGAEKSVFPIYGNSIRFILDNKNKTYSMSPQYRGFRVTVDSLDAEKSSVVRDEFWNEFHIQFANNYEVDTITRAFHSSNALFTDLLSDAIQRPIQHLDLNSRPEYHESIPGVIADSLYRWTLQESDNLFAEQIMLMISGQQSDTLSTEAGIDELQLTWNSSTAPQFPGELIWRDGSGLSRYNMFKPTELQKLISLFDTNEILGLLPQGQTSGTLEDWYGPYVFAKTGTLSNNHALVGYVLTDKGKYLQFVLIANHYTASTSTVRKSMGVMLEKIKTGF
ncbi:D-alanyl-D-alanine carboxypeptidase [Roseivirga sp.]|uniref:D-alanyl-D-alanine carboxypeptidase n=1 Tax=Roseivirga sp. TaxID=1964215 RepID=UPI003B52AEF9